MMQKICLLIFLQFLCASYSSACGNFSYVISSEIFPDGGSIKIVMRGSCGPLVVDYLTPIEGEARLIVDGSLLPRGGMGESIMLKRFDKFIQKKSKRNSLAVLREIEMKRFVQGDVNSLTPLFGLMESLCREQRTQLANNDLCYRYTLEK